MPWNFRLIDSPNPDDPDYPRCYTIHRCYYEEEPGKAEPTLTSWCPTPHSPWSESAEGLKWEVERMLVAFDRPALLREELATLGETVDLS